MTTFPVLSTDHCDAGIFQALCTRLYPIAWQEARRAIISSRKIDLLKKKRQPTHIAAGVLFVLACVTSVISIGTAQAAGQKEIVWAFDVARPGSNLPPTGRSLFDYIFSTDRAGKKNYNVPYPFEQLRQRIRIHTQGNGKAEVGFRETLIPLSRALPRQAAAPEFFKYPRLVLAVDSDYLSSKHQRGPMLKDRLYIGYQEKAESLEIISYNEVAGRFEFQIVRDYAAGRTPRVIYAERRLCVSCHQNGGPIFSEPLWSETNGNPEIGRRVLKEMQSFHGVPSYSGYQPIDQPRAISDAIGRANLFSAYQQIWRKGCADGMREPRAIACRSSMLMAALQYKLSGSRHFDSDSNRFREDFVEPLRQAWYRNWPDGLSIPDPLVPDRDPLVTGVEVAAEFDPLRLRPPLQLWSVDEPGVIETVVKGLSQFISNGDARRLDAHLFAAAASSPEFTRTWHETPCALSRRRYEGLPDRIVFRCEQKNSDTVFTLGHFFISGDGGIIGETGGFKLGERTDFEEFSLSANTVHIEEGLSSVSLSAIVKRTGLHPRLPDGSAVESIELFWPSIIEEDFGPSDEFPAYRDNGRLVITLVRDFDPVHDAITSLGRDALAGDQNIFSDQPFRRSLVIGGLFDRMGMRDTAQCCGARHSFPDALVESSVHYLDGKADIAASASRSFVTYCATCHATSGSFPPNFLYGATSASSDAIVQCGERIAYRLAMWDRPREERSKSPMPPESFLLNVGINPREWRTSTSFVELRNHVSGLPGPDGAPEYRADIFAGKAYETLRPCLATEPPIVDPAG